METSPEALIEQLLEQNKQLRLEIAVLTARKLHLEDVERQFEQSSKGLTEEVWNSLTPEVQKVLMNLDIK
jgi:hypothetical protein